MRALAFLLMALPLAACDKITGAADQKIADAEAIGFACRVAQKQPEACMKENEAQSPSSILEGWKSADEDIKGGKLDPTMSNVSSGSASSAKPEGAEGDKPAEGEEKKDEKAGEETLPAKNGKDGKDATEGKAGKEKDKSHD